jgi:Family of unknown function (DUF6590)
MMLWTERAQEPVNRDTGARRGSYLSVVWLKGAVHSEIRRFVVIQEGYGNCICS